MIRLKEKDEQLSIPVDMKEIPKGCYINYGGTKYNADLVTSSVFDGLVLAANVTMQNGGTITLVSTDFEHGFYDVFPQATIDAVMSLQNNHKVFTVYGTGTGYGGVAYKAGSSTGIETHNNKRLRVYERNVEGALRSGLCQDDKVAYKKSGRDLDVLASFFESVGAGRGVSEEILNKVFSSAISHGVKMSKGVVGGGNYKNFMSHIYIYNVLAHFVGFIATNNKLFTDILKMYENRMRQEGCYADTFPNGNKMSVDFATFHSDADKMYEYAKLNLEDIEKKVSSGNTMNIRRTITLGDMAVLSSFSSNVDNRRSKGVIANAESMFFHTDDLINGVELIELAYETCINEGGAKFMDPDGKFAYKFLSGSKSSKSDIVNTMISYETALKSQFERDNKTRGLWDYLTGSGHMNSAKIAIYNDYTNANAPAGRRSFGNDAGGRRTTMTSDNWTDIVSGINTPSFMNDQNNNNQGNNNGGWDQNGNSNGNGWGNNNQNNWGQNGNNQNNNQGGWEQNNQNGWGMNGNNNNQNNWNQNGNNQNSWFGNDNNQNNNQNGWGQNNWGNNQQQNFSQNGNGWFGNNNGNNNQNNGGSPWGNQNSWNNNQNSNGGQRTTTDPDEIINRLARMF